MRYLIGLLVTIAVIIFVIIRLLSGGSSTPSGQTQALASLATTDSVVRLTISNPVQASEKHREVRITVGRDLTDFALYKGYDESLVRTKTYSMNEASFANFLRALDLSGNYTKGNDDPALKDERGYCGLGDRYVYEILDGDGNVKQHYWSTSCGQKTFKGRADTVQTLFKKQVPDYFELTSDVEF
ncbi:hypothetical protein BH09PAT4_BH09PAT4_07890 [soil metagenome]